MITTLELQMLLVLYKPVTELLSSASSCSKIHLMMFTGTSSVMRNWLCVCFKCVCEVMHCCFTHLVTVWPPLSVCFLIIIISRPALFFFPAAMFFFWYQLQFIFFGLFSISFSLGKWATCVLGWFISANFSKTQNEDHFGPFSLKGSQRIRSVTGFISTVATLDSTNKNFWGKSCWCSSCLLNCCINGLVAVCYHYPTE